MGGIQGVGGLPPTPEQPNQVRGRRASEQAESRPSDGVSLSDEAQGAASAIQAAQQAAGESEIRTDRVAEAREALERGEYKLEDRVAEVAKRLLKIL